MAQGAGVFLLLLLVCAYLDSLRSSSQRASVSYADDKERERSIRRMDRRARWQSTYTACQRPWPWWFLGSCLAFAGLFLVAGVSSWPANDAPALLVGGTVFLIAFAFKAWAQEQALAHQARLHVRLAQLWQRVTRA